MKPIFEDNLKGKYVEYIDKNEAMRIGRVVRVDRHYIVVRGWPLRRRKDGRKAKGMRVRVEKARVLARIKGKNRKQPILWRD